MTVKKKDQKEDSTMKETGIAPTVDADDEAKSSAKKKSEPKKSGKAKKTVNPAPKAQPAKAAKKAKDDDDDLAVVEQVKDIRQFLKEVYIEFQKITWPDRAQVIRETYSVLFLVTVITLMVLAFDWAIGAAVFGPLEHWARLHGGGIGRG